jgi:hypothetical protein
MTAQNVYILTLIVYSTDLELHIGTAAQQAVAGIEELLLI